MIAVQCIRIFDQLQGMQRQQGFSLYVGKSVSPAQSHVLDFRSCGTTRDTSQLIFEWAEGKVSLDILIQEGTTVGSGCMGWR